MLKSIFRRNEEACDALQMVQSAPGEHRSFPTMRERKQLRGEQHYFSNFTQSSKERYCPGAKCPRLNAKILQCTKCRLITCSFMHQR